MKMLCRNGLSITEGHREGVGGWGDISFRGETTEEFLYLWPAYCLLVPPIVGKDEELDPIDTGFLGRARINL